MKLHDEFAIKINGSTVSLIAQTCLEPGRIVG
jgi:hypothetical protein